ncbi:MAG: EamA family transporter [Alphaproteobacteria bacterium]|jgi:drug/metabolite transporter (DMT)-like permease|nr:EamA family transporter [Alphaproteobacteria bacterium]
MTLEVTLLVLLAALLHAGWNALVKAGEDRLLAITMVIGVAAVGAALALPFLAPPAPASWIYLILSVVLHAAYFFLLSGAYRVGDLSHVYPVARGTAPLLVAIGAALFAGEHLGSIAMGGLLLAALAIASFALDGHRRGADRRPLIFALAIACFISTYTVVDGLGVRAAGDALGYIAWLFALHGLPLFLYVLIWRRRDLAPYLQAHWKTGLLGGGLCAGAYGLVIWALGQGAMAYVSALRETSVIFAVWIGTRLLGEPFGRRRLLAAAAVAAGIAVMKSAE